METQTTGKFLYHDSCPKCGSEDNVAVYLNSDGTVSGYCFTPGCGYTFRIKDEQTISNYVVVNKLSSQKNRSKGVERMYEYNGLIKDIVYKDLKKRGLKKAVCEKLDYGIGRFKGDALQVATYYDENKNPVAQKLRFPDKTFMWLGNPHQITLFGQHAWSGGGKRIVITEGEIDALSVAQAFNGNWQVVSIPNGAPNAYRDLVKHIEWLESFEEIVIAFDNDPAGRKAVDKVIPLFTPGKVKVANWSPYKDANEMLLAEGEKAVRNVIFGAEIYRPDEIVAGNDIDFDVILNPPDAISYDLPFPMLNRMIGGLRPRELTLIAAGTGVGKSTISREIAYHFLKHTDLKIGYIALEESTIKTAISLLALDNNVPFGSLFLDRSLVPQEKLKKSYDTLINNGRLFFYDHFGSTDPLNMLNRIKYMKLALGVDFVFLDHISMIFAGYGGSNVWQSQANFVEQLRSIIENIGVGVIAVSHLRKSHEKNAHEEGAKIDLDDLKGASDIKQFADTVIVLEKKEENRPRIKVLKNRLFGTTGYADQLIYNPATGRLFAEDMIEFTEETTVEVTEEEDFGDFGLEGEA